MLRRARYGAAALLTLAACLAAPAAFGEAPAGHCFEIIAAQGERQPALLLDRCSGKTWRLTRRRGGEAFRWVLLSREEPRTVAAAPVIRPSERGKCFTFDGRKFCE